MESFISEYPFWFTALLLAVVWDLAWRAVGMWHAARMSRMGWFISFAILGTIGILPIIFLRKNNIV